MTLEETEKIIVAERIIQGVGDHESVPVCDPRSEGGCASVLQAAEMAEVADFYEPITFEWTKEKEKIRQAVKKFSESTETDLT